MNEFPVQHFSSRIVFPFKIVAGAFITYSIYLGSNLFVDALSEKEWWKGFLALLLLSIPVPITRFVMVLKYFKILNKKLLVVDLFNTEKFDPGQVTSSKRINFFLFAIGLGGKKKFYSIYFFLSRSNWKKIEIALGR